MLQLKHFAVLIMFSASPAFSNVIFQSNLAEAKEKAVQAKIGSKENQLLFDVTEIKAKANQPVTVTFKNNASKDSGLQHNWVLVKPGTADKVGQAGMTAGPDKSYLPDSPDILAHTKLLKPGEKDKVKFKAPSTPGEYPYICTFPGHYTMMKGVLKVE